MQRELRVITLQGAIEKNEWLEGTIIILYFGSSKNIFTDYILQHIKVEYKISLHFLYQYELEIDVGCHKKYFKAELYKNICDLSKDQKRG